MLLRKKVEIEDWLNQYYITNYELIEDDEYGYVVNVNSFVKLNHKNLKSIDVKFNIINGYFDCSGNKLESLEGCPKIVEGSFNCGYNQLISLIECPEYIRESFYCYNNLLNIDGLKFLPKNIHSNYINLEENEYLGALQKIINFNELKQILIIYQEKNTLDNLMNKEKKSTNIINIVGKINKI